MEHLRHPERREPQDRLRTRLPLGGGSESDEADDDGSVLVIWGANMDELDAAGLTVDEARAQLATAYNIAPDAEANVNGVTSAGDTRLRAGDNLEFVHAAGEKGGV
jgi:hypothetical protein